MSKFLFTVVLLINFILISPQALSSGGMTANFGTFTTGVGDGNGIRYKVELDKVGQLLRGKPNSKIIELVTIHAPGTNIREILIRELRADDGNISLLLTAPDDLTDKFQHATIYLNPTYAKMALIENIGGRWEQRDSIAIPLAPNTSSQTPQTHITAFHLSSLGENKLIKNRPYLPEISHTSTPDTNITSALWPWLVSSLLLMLAWVVSRWMHAVDWRGGQ